jgi:hypothetical protein
MKQEKTIYDLMDYMGRSVVEFTEKKISTIYILLLILFITVSIVATALYWMSKKIDNIDKKDSSKVYVIYKQEKKSYSPDLSGYTLQKTRIIGREKLFYYIRKEKTGNKYYTESVFIR